MTRVGSCRAFTLLEVILAMGIMAVLAVSLFTALSVAFKAKRGAEASLDAIREGEAAMELIRAEFESALPPRGFLADAFTGRAWVGANGGRDDDVTFFSTGPTPPSAHAINPVAPLPSDIKQVDLVVLTLEGTGERVLTRRVLGNLLAPTGVELVPDDEVLVRNVSSFQLRYYDGYLWTNDWDSTLNYDALPVAVEITLELDPPESRTRAGDYRPLRFSRVVHIPCTGEGELERDPPPTTDTGGTGQPGADGAGAPAQGGGT
jgi:prepilin-type N-terminal cleavage/methylation domain-containing protein